MRVAFCVAEMFPFAKTGGLADVAGALPIALEDIGVQVDVFLPYYQSISDEAFEIKKVSDCVYKTSVGKNITVYLMYHKEYFGREGLYGDVDGDYKDNFERFYWFNEAILKFIQSQKQAYDIVHCHDWHVALIPVLLKEKFKELQVLSILTVHNLAYQGVFDKAYQMKMDLPSRLTKVNAFDFYGQINWLKAGLLYADQITTVSPNYAEEILTKEFGCGLEETLQERKKNLSGIVNGLDGEIWNPKTDPLIDAQYSLNDIKKAKQVNKEKLQSRVGLPIDSSVPLFGFVGRIAHQKGLDLLLESADALAKLNIQWVIQGVGDQRYYPELKKIQEKYSKQCAICLDFDEQLAHQIYAGSDFFLMPSVFEPCGLSQMISFRYGTLPVAYSTGGLTDTIIEYDKPNGNGFLFTQYTQENFMDVVKEALAVYSKKNQMNELIKQAMQADFSWKRSAQKYKKLYTCLQSD